METTGHYTQVVWADTYKVGCGFSQYKQNDFNMGLYVCNYGPGGNVIGAPLYKVGTACSDCPEGTTCSTTFKGLCAGEGTSKSNTGSHDKVNNVASNTINGDGQRGDYSVRDGGGSVTYDHSWRDSSHCQWEWKCADSDHCKWEWLCHEHNSKEDS